MVTAAPTQARSVRRRQALLDAAIDLLAEGGARAITHRGVAARAGLPAATTTYYFDSIQALTEEALRRHVDQRVEELTAIGASAIGEGGSLDQIAWRFAAALAALAHPTAVAQFEVYLEAARNPTLRPAVGEALAAFERFAEASLAALGAREPARAAHGLVALIDGFMLHRVTRPDDHDPAGLFEAMRALLVTQLVDQATAAALFTQFERVATPLRS